MEGIITRTNGQGKYGKKICGCFGMHISIAQQSMCFHGQSCSPPKTSMIFRNWMILWKCSVKRTMILCLRPPRVRFRHGWLRSIRRWSGQIMRDGTINLGRGIMHVLIRPYFRNIPPGWQGSWHSGMAEIPM